MRYSNSGHGIGKGSVTPWARQMMLALVAATCLPGCTTLGSMMSPYSEKFSCKNSDHGQCIHPARAYEDAVLGVGSKSDPEVTNDSGHADRTGSSAPRGRLSHGSSDYAGYRDSVYRELRGLIDAPVTPMLKPARTVRTLILSYADREHADRLYMPRYIYSVIDRPVWVIGGALVASPQRPDPSRILDQVRDGAPTGDVGAAAPAASAKPEVQP